MQAIDYPVPPRRVALSAVTTLAFVILGLMSAILGPILPWLASRWGTSLDQAGALITVNFLGEGVAFVLSGFLLDRVSRKLALVLEFALFSAGLIGVALVPDMGLALASAAILGLGWGGLVVLTNVFLAELYPERRTQAFNLMSTVAGIGALAGPLLVGLSTEVTGTPAASIIGTGAVSLLTGLGYAVLTFPRRVQAASSAAISPAGVLALLREPYVLALTLLLFIYVSLEIGFGAWVYSFALQGPGLDDAGAVLVASDFRAAFTVGRLAAGVAARWVAGRWLVLGGAGMGVLGAALIALLPANSPAMFIGTALVGLGCGPIFPTVMALATDRYPAAASTIFSIALLGGALGGTFLPYGIGYLLVQGGVSVAAGACALAMLLIGGLEVLLAFAFGGAHRAAQADQQLS